MSSAVPSSSLILKIAAGALIPSVATIIFNVMHFFSENYDKRPLPELSPSVFDIGIGCAFSIIGICVTTKDHEKSKALLILFVVLLLALIAGELLAPALLKWDAARMTSILNVVSFLALCYALAETE